MTRWALFRLAPTACACRTSAFSIAASFVAAVVVAAAAAAQVNDVQQPAEHPQDTTPADSQTDSTIVAADAQGLRIHAEDEQAASGPPIEFSADDARQAAGDPARIASLIAQLGDPSFAVRDLASAKLCIIGHAAAPALKRASEAKDFEVSMRAAELLEIIESVYFGGCKVRIAIDRAEIAWNEPMQLAVRIVNESDYPAVAPFDTDRRRRDALPEHVRQVGDMMDLADQIVVTGPDGDEVRLRVDDIREDPQVADAIEWRAHGGPEAALQPGRQIERNIAAFNRALARYPMLEAGRYEIQFVYQPDWTDERYHQARAGYVESNKVELRVTNSAPDIVRQSHSEAIMTVTRQGDEFIANITNTRDVPRIVNTDLGVTGPPWANLVWSLQRGEEEEDFSFHPIDQIEAVDSPKERAPFDGSRLISLTPGETLEIGRIHTRRLKTGRLWNPAQAENDDLAAAPASASPLTITATYSNRCNRAWQLAQNPPLIGSANAPKILQSPLPLGILTGYFANTATVLPNGE